MSQGACKTKAVTHLTKHDNFDATIARRVFPFRLFVIIGDSGCANERHAFARTASTPRKAPTLPLPEYTPFRLTHNSTGEPAHAAYNIRHHFITDQSRRHGYVPIRYRKGLCFWRFKVLQLRYG